ncbi:3213_t:CDS:2, partial [Funneliformis geosporum]
NFDKEDYLSKIEFYHIRKYYTALLMIIFIIIIFSIPSASKTNYT